MDCSLISLFNSRRRITSFDDNGDDTESVLSSHSHSSRSTHSSNASFHGTYRTPGPSIGRSFDRNVYKFIHNNPQFQFMNAHVKDGVTNNNSSNTSYDVRNSGADSSILGMSTALEESIDYEQILFANCVLKSESLKGIARNTNNKRSNIETKKCLDSQQQVLDVCGAFLRHQSVDSNLLTTCRGFEEILKRALSFRWQRACHNIFALC